MARALSSQTEGGLLILTTSLLTQKVGTLGILPLFLTESNCTHNLIGVRAELNLVSAGELSNQAEGGFFMQER